MNVNFLKAGVWSPFPGWAGEGSSGVERWKETKSFRIFRFESFSALPPGRFSRSVDFASLPHAPPTSGEAFNQSISSGWTKYFEFLFFSLQVGRLARNALEVISWSTRRFTRLQNKRRQEGEGKNKKRDSNRRKEMKKQTVHSFLRFFSIQISGSSSSCARLSNDMRNERKFI